MIWYSGRALAGRGLLGGVADADIVPSEIPAWRLGLVVLLLGIPISVSVWMGLGLHWSLAIGGVRCVVQLMSLGYVLNFIFDWDHWWVAAVYISFMLTITTLEAISRPQSTYPVRAPTGR